MRRGRSIVLAFDLVLGRVVVGRGQAELDVVGARLAEEYPDTRGWAAVVAPMRNYLTRESRPTLLTLSGAMATLKGEPQPEGAEQYDKNAAPAEAEAAAGAEAAPTVRRSWR